MRYGQIGGGCLVLFVVGCGISGCSSENLGESDYELNTNDKAAYDFFVGKGLTNFQAAGIVGNLDQESNVIPTAVQSGGPGRGIAQWSVGGRWDTTTNDNAVWYASKQGLGVWTLQLQLEFIWYELTTFSGFGLAALKASTDVSGATIAFENDFEKCGNCQQANRISYAQAVLNAYGSSPYAAQFVSQSFPYASTTMTMTQGDVLPAYIELKNIGTKSWDSNTRIGTTMPRDRKSVFADSSWISPSRLAGVSGSVAPGATYKFTFNLAATTPGTFDEHFGVVEEGVAWFSDNGQGGPPDSQLEVKINVVAKDGGAAPDAGGTTSDAGKAGDAGSGGPGDGGPPIIVAQTGGCAVAGAPRASSRTGDLGLAVALAGVVFGARQRRRRLLS